MPMYGDSNHFIGLVGVNACKSIMGSIVIFVWFPTDKRYYFTWFFIVLFLCACVAKKKFFEYKIKRNGSGYLLSNWDMVLMEIQEIGVINLLTHDNYKKTNDVQFY